MRMLMVVVLAAFALAACEEPAPSLETLVRLPARETAAEDDDEGTATESQETLPAPNGEPAPDTAARPDGGAPIDASGPPPPACAGIPEVEPNDGIGNANALSKDGVVCGRLDSLTDVDMFSITTKQLSLKISADEGAVVTVAADNREHKVTGTGALAFATGTRVTYLIEVRSSGRRGLRYTIGVTAR